jgi:bifunctional DNase/RNase
MHICWLGGQGSKSNIIHKNIMNGFMATRIWPFNPKAMDFRTRPNDAYMLTFQMKTMMYLMEQLMKVDNGGGMELPHN